MGAPDPRAPVSSSICSSQSDGSASDPRRHSRFSTRTFAAQQAKHAPMHAQHAMQRPAHAEQGRPVRTVRRQRRTQGRWRAVRLQPHFRSWSRKAMARQHRMTTAPRQEARRISSHSQYSSDSPVEPKALLAAAGSEASARQAVARRIELASFRSARPEPGRPSTAPSVHVSRCRAHAAVRRLGRCEQAFEGMPTAGPRLPRAAARYVHPCGLHRLISEYG